MLHVVVVFETVILLKLVVPENVKERFVRPEPSPVNLPYRLAEESVLI